MSDEPTPYQKPVIRNYKSYWKKRKINEKLVSTAYLTENQSVEEISKRFNIPANIVRTIISTHSLKQEAKEMRQELISQAISAKLPLLQQITGLTLSALRDFLEDLATNPVRKANLTVQDARQLSSIVKEINEIARLEEGQSTQNWELRHTIGRDASVILSEIKEKDPFIDYESATQLPAPAITIDLSTTNGSGAASVLTGKEEVPT